MTLQSGNRVAGKKALVTGAAQGLGAASARMLARHGAKVLLTDVNLGDAEAVAASINQECGAGVASALYHDVTDAAQWTNAIDQARQRMGGLSVLVNNAGLATLGTIEDLDLVKWRRTMQVNADSVFLGCKAALALLRDNQPASIINMCSVSGLIASPNLPAYNASKAAVWLLTKSIALLTARKAWDVRCNSIHPTFIRTPILEAFRGTRDEAEMHERLARTVPLGRLGEPEDVAYAVLYLASDESRFVTASELKVDGGISAV